MASQYEWERDKNPSEDLHSTCKSVSSVGSPVHEHLHSAQVCQQLLEVRPGNQAKVLQLQQQVAKVGMQLKAPQQIKVTKINQDSSSLLSCTSKQHDEEGISWRQCHAPLKVSPEVQSWKRSPCSCLGCFPSQGWRSPETGKSEIQKKDFENRLKILPHWLSLLSAHPWELCMVHMCLFPSPDRWKSELVWRFNKSTLKSSLKAQSLSLASKLEMDPRVSRNCSAVSKGTDGAWKAKLSISTFKNQFLFSWFSSQYFQVFLPLRLLIVWLWVLLVSVQAPGDFDLFVTGQAKMGEKLFRKMWVYLSKGKDEKEPGAFRGHPGKCGSHSSRGLPLEDWARGGGTSDQCLSDLTLEREYQEKYIFRRKYFFLQRLLPQCLPIRENTVLSQGQRGSWASQFRTQTSDQVLGNRK